MKKEIFKMNLGFIFYSTERPHQAIAYRMLEQMHFEEGVGIRLLVKAKNEKLPLFFEHSGLDN